MEVEEDDCIERGGQEAHRIRSHVIARDRQCAGACKSTTHRDVQSRRRAQCAMRGSWRWISDFPASRPDQTAPTLSRESRLDSGISTKKRWTRIQGPEIREKNDNKAPILSYERQKP